MACHSSKSNQFGEKLGEVIYGDRTLMIIVEDTVMYAQLARSVELHHLDHTAKTCRFVYNLLSCQMRTTVYGPSHDRLVSLYVQQIVCNIILLLCSIWRSATMRMR